jgi:hypothetical protein
MMATLTQRWLAVWIAGMGLVGGRAAASDLFTPCWRGQAGSTVQTWRFDTNANPAQPEAGTNPYGGADATMVVGPFGSGWLNRLSSLGTNTGYWDLGRTGTMTLTIPNRTDASTNSYKDVWVQVTQWQDGGIYNEYAAVSIPGATLLGGQRQLVVNGIANGGWWLDLTRWRLAPNPVSETILITSAFNGSVIDQVVVDTRCVDVVCPPDIVASADPGQCSKASVTYVLPPVDGCAVTNIVCVPPSGSAFLVGVSNVTCSFTDAGGQTVACSFTVTVTDNQAPTITAPPAVAVTTAPGLCVATGVTLGVPVTGDNCGVASVTSDAPAQFPVGATLVTWTVTDPSGNTAIDTQTVTVTDVELPQIVCPPDPVVVAAAGECNAVVSFTVTASDNCTVTNLVCEPASGSPFAVGLTPVNCTATDASGNSASCRFQVTVQDTTGPVVCADPGRWSLAQGGTNDNFASAEPGTPSDGLLDYLFGMDIGGYGGDCADQFFATTLSNLPARIVEARLRLRLRACSGSENDVVTLLFVNPDGDRRPERWSYRLGTSGLPGLLPGAWTEGAVEEFVLDLSALPCTNGPAMDLFRPLNEVGYLDVIVRDDTLVDYVVLETVSCPCGPDVGVTAEPAACGAVVAFALPPFVDPCEGTNVAVVCDPPSGFYFPLGSTPVTCVASDQFGNLGSCSFMVTVNAHPDDAPVLRIKRQSRNDQVVVISWPVTCHEYRLEQTDDLNPLIVWERVMEPAVIENGRWTLRRPADPSARFYRLRKL